MSRPRGAVRTTCSTSGIRAEYFGSIDRSAPVTFGVYSLPLLGPFGGACRA
mgnify:CR=1 FL=1